MANSMIKKLYSSKHREDSDDDGDGDEDGDLTAVLAGDKEIVTPERLIQKEAARSKDPADKLKESILNRETFSYSYYEVWKQKWFRSRLCCCCRVEEKRAEFLQKDARKKLSHEVDILEIVKKLRVHQFASEVTLKPNQMDMVNYFDQYTLDDGKGGSRGSASEHSQAIGARHKSAANLED